MVVEIFIAQGYGIDTLAKHLLDAVPNVTGMTVIGHTCGQRFGQADLFVHFSQQQCARIGAEATAEKVSDKPPAIYT